MQGVAMAFSYASCDAEYRSNELLWANRSHRAKQLSDVALLSFSGPLTAYGEYIPMIAAKTEGDVHETFPRPSE
jgi:hypothetical protein